MGLYDTLFGPVEKNLCNILLSLSIIMFVLFSINLLIEISYILMGDFSYIDLIQTLYQFLLYYIFRILYTICNKQ